MLSSQYRRCAARAGLALVLACVPATGLATTAHATVNDICGGEAGDYVGTFSASGTDDNGKTVAMTVTFSPNLVARTEYQKDSDNFSYTATGTYEVDNVISEGSQSSSITWQAGAGRSISSSYRPEFLVSTRCSDTTSPVVTDMVLSYNNDVIPLKRQA
ncbi:hypothetical protein [Kitasatospora sp. NPDC056531]|uniref:hypothetical protein n=1 Tax=Kitasatospora sp. NPDC056531 TaxID=3345856 RepID=UPI0036CCAE45